jgi:hypothetical protein
MDKIIEDLQNTEMTPDKILDQEKSEEKTSVTETDIRTPLEKHIDYNYENDSNQIEVEETEEDALGF